MKKITLIIMVFSLYVISCDNVEPDQPDLEEFGLNTSENREKIQNLLNGSSTVDKYRDDLDDFAEEYFKDQVDQNALAASLLDIYVDCSSCGDEYKEFMTPLLSELLYAKNHEVLNLIDHYRTKVSTLNLNNQVKSDLLFILFSFEVKASYEIQLISENELRPGFWNCLRNTIGRGIGEGIVTGFVGGCIQGAWATGAAGTAVFPVVGTVAGGVAGCVAGGAVGSVIGAAGGAAMSAAKCIF